MKITVWWESDGGTQQFETVEIDDDENQDLSSMETKVRIYDAAEAVALQHFRWGWTLED